MTLRLAATAIVVLGVWLAAGGQALAAPGDCVVPKKLGVVFVLDDSSSMATNDPQTLRANAFNVGIDALPDGTVVAASKFNGESARLFAPTALTEANRATLKGAVSSQLEDFDGTDYDVAFSEAKAQLDAMQGVDKRAVVFLSDGEPNFSYSADRAIAAEGVPIFSIGFGTAQGGEMSAIARRSGGQAFFLSSASQSPEIFARIVSTLSCDIQNTDVSVDLKPGQSKTFDFHVDKGLPGFHALVTWSTGDLKVELVRPDGSTLSADTLKSGERFSQEGRAVSVSVARPPPGHWKVRVTALKSSARKVTVKIDNWERGDPGQNSSEDPRGAPKPTGGPGCRAKASFHGIEAEAGCFKFENGVFSASGRVRIDGLDVIPKGNAKIELDPAKLEIRTTGSVSVEVGSITLYSGTLEKSLQGHIDLPVPKAVSKLKGFPITGDATVSFENGIGKLDLTVSIKQLGNVTGTASLTASNSAGLQLTKAAIDLKEAKIKAIPIKDVHLGYEATDEGDKWDGSAKVELPSPTVQSISGGASFLNGDFASANAAVDGNFPIAEAIFLTHLDASLQLKPSFAFGGGMGVSAGPKILGVRAVGVDGHFDFASGAEPGDPDEYKLSGDVSVADKFELANGSIAYKTDGQLTLEAELNFEIAGVGFEGNVSGFADGDGFEVTGDGTVGYKGHGIGGQGIISSVGVAACANLDLWVSSIDVGFGVKWSDFTSPTIFGGSCDFGDWSVSGSAAAVGPGGSHSFRLERGLPAAAFSVVGAGAPPRVTLTGPGGVRVATPSPNAGLVATRTTAAFANTSDNTTYFAVNKPAAGTWTIHVDQGSAPVTEFRSANGLSEPNVRAHVSGHGRTRTLTFKANSIPGQRLVFYEAGKGVAAQIGSSSKARGKLEFRALDARARHRRIVVEVQQNGLPRSRARVASYTAPPAIRPRRVSSLSIVRSKRKHRRAIVRWGRSSGAASYELRINVSDGRRLLLTRKARTRHVRVGDIDRGEHLRARVVPISAAGRRGVARSARGPVKPHKHHRRHHEPPHKPPFTG